MMDEYLEDMPAYFNRHLNGLTSTQDIVASVRLVVTASPSSLEVQCGFNHSSGLASSR